MRKRKLQDDEGVREGGEGERGGVGRRRMREEVGGQKMRSLRPKMAPRRRKTTPRRPKMAPSRRKMPKNWSKTVKDSGRVPAMSPRRSTWYGARSERRERGAADVCKCSRLHFQFQIFTGPKLVPGRPRKTHTRLSTMSPRRSTRHGARSERASAASVESTSWQH